MAKTPSNFKTETQLSTTGVVLSSSVSGGAAQNIIRAVTFFNQSATTLMTVKVYRFLSTGALSDNSLIIQKDIAPRRTWNATELQGKVIGPGYELTATATANSTVNAEVDGIIFS